ncbi:MAG TPA: ATP-dependent helicase HrpB [Thermoanaerobaculia bacterium]|jgi:ATP-dependent helicase HrpB|nr:ATP-dependent helicase HrpB [Thermoanaerobaculia bacterium]
MPVSLPIDDVLPELIAAITASGDTPSAVLVAPPGAGKTTRVPPALLAAGIGGGRRIVVLEPRRIAARAAARRMAEENGWTLGGEVGYQVRFERRAGPETRILVVTEGILVQMLQADPFLEEAGAVIFDEFHERSLQTDLSLAMARRVQREARPDLVLLAMSATLDPGPVAAFLGNCPTIESRGRLHPVDIQFIDRPDERPLPAQIASGVRRVLGGTSGDVLVFLPGVGEIQRCTEALAGLAAERNLAVLPLYGDLPAESQDAVLRPMSSYSAARKVVLATNVAETSITIDGVTAVVDSGLVRRLRFDPSTGLDRLEVGRVSRASADQRAGRAGRQAPGLCLRLWPAYENPALAERETPEIARVDLAGPALQLLAWGEPDLGAFGWFEAPAPDSLAAALLLLKRLGAVDGRPGHGVTSLGAAMARLPVHPRLARLLIEGHRAGRTREAALLAALLSERDPFPRGIRGGGPRRASRSDLLDRLDVLEIFERRGAPYTDLNAGAARFVLRARDQLAELARRDLGKAGERIDGDEPLLRALFAAYPDRLARRREPRSPRGVLVGGRGVRLSEESTVLEAELFVCVDLDAGRSGPLSEVLVRKASAVAPEWLPPESLRTSSELEFDAERERVAAWRRTRYEDLVIAEAEVPAPDADETERVLVQAAADRLDRALALDDPEVVSFLARVRCLADWMPELGLPRFGEEEIRELLPALAAGRRSFAELRRASLLDVLQGALSYEQLEAVRREAPEWLEVPSGSRVKLLYEPGQPPVLAARIQELFGLAETPRVAAGRIPVLLHLLAPNGRPQQVTHDLRSFWEKTYPQVRKELQGRYPRHAWPQDPWNATPERRPRRTRG